jgi:hypothetical protein
VGSSAGLMAMLVAVGVMSIGWMAVIAVLVTARKLLLAAAIVAFGVLIIVDPLAGSRADAADVRSRRWLRLSPTMRETGRR